jgi:hypothetical protein
LKGTDFLDCPEARMGRGEWLPAFQIIRVVFESLIRLEVLRREYDLARIGRDPSVSLH